MWRTRSGRALALALGTLAVVAGFTMTGWTADRPARPGPRPIPEGSSVAGPDDRPPAPDAFVPTAIEGAFPCPDGTKGFSNPVMHYRLCYPSTWGFSDFERAIPLEQVAVKRLGALRLLSSEAFPWDAGTRPFEEVLRRNAVDIELNLLQPGSTPADGECVPSDIRRSGSLTVKTCTQTYDLTGAPAPAGPITAMSVVVPLLRPPVSADTGADLTGSSLLVIVRAPSSRFAGEVDLGWNIVSTIVPF